MTTQDDVCGVKQSLAHRGCPGLSGPRIDPRSKSEAVSGDNAGDQASTGKHDERLEYAARGRMR